MTAGRLYVVQSWNNASAYSGEQIGTRLARSKELHFNRDGTANILAYSDEQPKAKKSIPVSHIVNPWNKKLDKLDEKEAALEQALYANEIDMDEYGNLYYVLCLEREKAFMGYMKSIGQLDEYTREQQQEYGKLTRGKRDVRIGCLPVVIGVIFVLLIMGV